MSRTRLRRVFPAALVLAVALPLSAAAARSSLAQASIAFGRAGGNIQPYRVAIARTGAVSASGAVSRSSLRSRIPVARANALLASARRAGFFAMPRLTECPRALPDAARFYVTVTTRAGTRTVAVHGGCRPAFNLLLAGVQAAVRR